MILKIFISFFLLFTSTVFSKDDISNLLSDFAQKSDLSKQTKKKSAGFLTVYTRQDLDHMQIHSLGEIIERIPFLRYNENNGGLSDPFYSPYQPSPVNSISIYINDRELLTPFNGNALQLFGQMSIGYIDHIEIYMGVPSQRLGIHASWVTIKCYTKDPKREETDLVGTSIGSYGTKELYGYSAKSLDNFSYLAYLNYRNLGRKHIKHNNNILSKDKDIANFYGEIRKDNLRVEMQIGKGSMDNFMGKSPNIDPKSNHTDFDYFYTGLYYKNLDAGWKASVNFTQDRDSIYDNSKTFLGIIPLPTFPYIYTYQNSRVKIKENISDMEIYKTIKTKKNKLVLGIQNRYKHFKFKEMNLGIIPVYNSSHYDTEFISSVLAENSYLINKSNMLTASLKYDYIFENGSVSNYKTYSGRIGYIYNDNKWTSKIFLFTGTTNPSMQTLFEDKVFYHQSKKLKTQKQTALATKLTYRVKNHKTSILYAHAVTKNTIYFDGTSYKNAHITTLTDTLDFSHLYNYDALDSILFDVWIDASYKNGDSLGNAPKYYGGLIQISNSIGKFDLLNSLIYKHWLGIDDDGWDFDSAITYHHSRELTFFLKAQNILGTALKSNYYSFNPLTMTNNYLNNVDTIDRKIWLGMEYQF